MFSDTIPRMFLRVFKLEELDISFLVIISIIVWFQKISIPPPRKTIGNSEGEGGLKGSNFREVGGFHGELVFQRVTNHVQNIESNTRSI